MTAKRLLSKTGPRPGLFKLWELKMLNSSVEAAVIQDRFRELFTDEEVSEARKRLDELNYFIDYGAQQ